MMNTVEGPTPVPCAIIPAGFGWLRLTLPFARVIHRDLSSLNVMLRADLSPVIVDFGLARVMKGETLRRSSLGRRGIWRGRTSSTREEEECDMDGR